MINLFGRFQVILLFPEVVEKWKSGLEKKWLKVELCKQGTNLHDVLSVHIRREKVFRVVPNGHGILFLYVDKSAHFRTHPVTEIVE